MVRPEVAIIIPAFNEEKTIGKVISSISIYGTVIVVNDASTDGTALEAANGGAVLVNHKENLGYDAALNAGFSKAAELGCSYAVTFDADGQHEASLVPEFIAALEKGNVVVVGARPKKARISEKLFALITNMLYGVRDPLCGMKGYRMSLYKERGYFDSYRSIGSEMMLYAVKNRYPYVQIDVPISQRVDKPRFGRLIKSNIKILRASLLSFCR